MGVPLHSIVYVSSATRPFTESELLALLRQSLEKNGKLGVTGMLLYKDGNFIQLLEGPEEAVRGVYTQIASDQRHYGLILLLDRPAERRLCRDWTMSFRDLNDPAVRGMPGYSEFLNEPLTASGFQAHPERAMRLLEVFRQSM